MLTFLCKHEKPETNQILIDKVVLPYEYYFTNINVPFSFFEMLKKINLSFKICLVLFPYGMEKYDKRKAYHMHQFV